MLTQPIKRHGGKHYLAKRIVAMMPPRCQTPNAPASDDPGWLHYVEPYFGAGSVLLANDPTGISEVVNDIDGGLTRFWKVMANPELFARFQRHVEGMPFAAQLFEDAADGLDCEDDVSAAVAFFVVNRQSRQALGKDFATLTRNRTRRGMNEQAAAWLSAVEGLPEVHRRLRSVVVLNDDAQRVIDQQDGPRTMFYLDPPYVHATRTVTDAYRHECDDQHHLNLLIMLAAIQGRFILSGYRCPLYDAAAERHGWHRVDIEIDNKAGRGETKQLRIESIWTNYKPQVTQDGRGHRSAEAVVMEISTDQLERTQ